MLAAEKKAIMQRQSALVASLNRLLPSIGYRVVAVSSETKAAARPSPRRASRAAKPLTCSECQRTFALPLHLGRHISVMHKGKGAAAEASTPAPASARASRAKRRLKRAIARKTAVRRRRAPRPKPAKKAKG
jgi:hypothetical protein